MTEVDINEILKDHVTLDIECIDLNDLERVVVRPAGGVSLLGVCYRKEI